MIYVQILLQAGILGVLVIGGLWLRNVVNQQSKLKDEQIKTLQARVDHAEIMAAPSVISQLEGITAYADKITAQLQEAKLQIHQKETTSISEDKIPSLLSGIKLASIADAAATQLIVKQFVRRSEAKSPDIRIVKECLYDLLREVNKLSGDFINNARSALDGKVPQFDSIKIMGREFPTLKKSE